MEKQFTPIFILDKPPNWVHNEVSVNITPKKYTVFLNKVCYYTFSNLCIHKGFQYDYMPSADSVNLNDRKWNPHSQ